MTAHLRSLSEQKKRKFEDLVVLQHLSQRTTPLTQVPGDTDEKWIEGTLRNLMKLGFVGITTDDKYYGVTEKGQEALGALENQKLDFLARLDGFCAVNMQTGEFGFSAYYETPAAAWKAHLNKPGFLDLRLTVYEYQHEMSTGAYDPEAVLDLVFVMFLTRNKFDTKSKDWQYRLINGDMWKEMLETATNYTPWKMIGDDPNGSPQVMDAIITAGTNVMIELAKKEEALEAERKANLAAAASQAQAASAGANGDTGSYTETVVEEEYVGYGRIYPQSVVYYDGYYASPASISDVWLTAILLDAMF